MVAAGGAKLLDLAIRSCYNVGITALARGCVRDRQFARVSVRFVPFQPAEIAFCLQGNSYIV